MSEKKDSMRITLTMQSFEEAVKVAFNTGIEYSLDLVNNGKNAEVSNKFASQFVENILNKHNEKMKERQSQETEAKETTDTEETDS